MDNAKIVISAAADSDLEEMKVLVNEGFQAGRVTKNQLASWIISFFKAAYFTKHIQTVRGDHFDEIAHLESAVRQMKAARDAGTEVELSSLLAPVLQRQKVPQASVPKRDPKFESKSKDKGNS